MVKGRYLNGEADLKASLRDGVLIVTLDSIEVNGKQATRADHDRDTQAKPRQGRLQGPKDAEMIRKLESLEIKDGKIILKVRAKARRSASAAQHQRPIPVEDRGSAGRAGEDRDTQGQDRTAPAERRLRSPESNHVIPAERRGHAFPDAYATACSNRSLVTFDDQHEGTE